MTLSQLFSSAQLWRGDDLTPAVSQSALPSGFSELNQLLPGGGWPGAGLTELLLNQQGIGELGLLSPLLRRLGQAERLVVWVAPPHTPYAPALSQAQIPLDCMRWISPHETGDGAWAAEQCLRSGSCGAVLFWPEVRSFKALRRLQLAAEKGGCPGFLFRPQAEASQSSPAPLRLNLSPRGCGLGVELLKCRGRRPGVSTCLAV